MTKHTILGGKVHIYRRENSSSWQCSAYLKGKNRRVSTKAQGLAAAKDFAEDWFLELRGKNRKGELIDERTFKQAAEKFAREYDILTNGQRNPQYVEGHHARLRIHLLPYFGKMGLSKITAGVVQEYRIYRMNGESGYKPPARSTLHHETVTLRLVLKTALRHRWLEHLPDLTLPYGSSKKITHRAWFSPEEYKNLYEATRARAKEAKGKHWQWAAEQLHDKVLFMANTGLRPDEINRLEFRDVVVVDDESSGGRILEIEVRGKRGIGYCKSMVGAVRPFERLRDRKRPVKKEVEDKDSETTHGLPQETDLLFPVNHKRQFNNILNDLDLKIDREGNRRTVYSLRHTYICMRLMEGADIYQIAKNCRTSVEMIEQYYASHIKNRLDTSLINVRSTRQ